MCRKSIHLISFVLVLATGGVAQAGLNDPPLLNDSFEEETSWGQPTPGWYDYDAGREEYWAFQETRGDDPRTTYGDVWGALRPGGIHWQKIGTWDAGATYQIDVLLGNRTTWRNWGIYISLWGGGNEALASDDTYPEAIGAIKLSESGILITDEVGGVMETKEVSTILSTGIGLTPGDPLWIQIESGNRAVENTGISYFDYPRIKLVRKASDADDPHPANGVTDVARDVVLSWKPGMYADQHDVYLGTNLDDVNDASRTNPLSVLAIQNQDPNIYVPPERLAFGETYYWRIDEVNAAPDYTVFKGSLWQFTVEPAGYPIDGVNITATASSTGQGDFGPENTVNGSGLDADDLHTTEATDMWLSGNAPLGASIQYEFDKVHKFHEMWVWNSNQSVESLIGFGLKDVTVEYSIDGTAWTALADVPEFTKAPGTPGYAHNTTVDFGGAVAKYIRLTATSNWGGVLPQFGLSEVRFFSMPVRAREPSPDAETADVNPAVTLAWRAGREAVTHNVYVSTDEQAVIDGNAPVVNVADASYSSDLDLANTYYWRIDEVNETGTPTIWEGDVWGFSTSEYLVVDDFESYNDTDPPDPESHRIFESWSDGFGVATNGALIGYDPPQPSYAETTIVHSGDQSLPLFYSNTGGATSSETARTFAMPQDWTKHGIRTLGLYYYGAVGNTGQLYVKVNGVKVPYDGDVGNLAAAVWQPWNIDLKVLGVNLASVTTLAIGIDDNGAAGTLYLDDIRLYAYSRELITPVQPDPDGLVGLWEFDEGAGTAAMDSSGNGHHGTLEGNSQWVAGYSGTALQLGGSPDRVVVPYSAQLNPDNAFTVSVWANVEPGSSGYRSPITSRDDSPQRGYIIYAGSNGNWQFWIGNGSAWSAATGPPIQAGEWTHVVGVYDNSELKLYINGVQAGQGSGTISLNTQAYLSIGAGATNSPQGNYFFVGMIDDTRVYNRVLSEGEIAGLAGRILPFDKAF